MAKRLMEEEEEGKDEMKVAMTNRGNLRYVEK